MTDASERENACASASGEMRDADEKGKKREVAECDAVAGGGKGLESGGANPE